MKRKTHASSTRLIRKREAWMKKLADVGPIMRGSLVTAQRGNHVAHQLTVSVKGKTHTVYVPINMVEEVKEWIQNYRQMQRIIKKVSKLSMAIIHRRVPENRGVGKSARKRSLRR
ncbi:DUF6788 family protein [Verrucomicrobiota bacterium]